MANGGFLIGNLAGLATPVCAYANSDYPAANLIDLIPSVYYRSTGGTALPRWNFGSAKSITSFAMFNHNIPSDATIKLQFSSNNWASVAEEVTLTWASLFLHKTFTAKYYQYAGLSAVTTLSYVEIGEVFWGTVFPFVRNYNWEYHRIKRVHKEIRNNNGHQFVSILGVQRGYNISFEAVDDTEMDKFDSLLEEEKLVFVPDTGLVPCIFGTIENMEIDGDVSISGNKFSLIFMGDRQGGV